MQDRLAESLKALYKKTIKKLAVKAGLTIINKDDFQNQMEQIHLIQSAIDKYHKPVRCQVRATKASAIYEIWQNLTILRDQIHNAYWKSLPYA